MVRSTRKLTLCPGAPGVPASPAFPASPWVKNNASGLSHGLRQGGIFHYPVI